MMILSIGNRATVTDIASVADASRIYLEHQDASGEGGSTFPSGKLANGADVAEISYNGRVWADLNGERHLVYCPWSAPVDEGRPDIFRDGFESVCGKKCSNPHMAGTLKHRVFALGVASANRALGK